MLRALPLIPPFSSVCRAAAALAPASTGRSLGPIDTFLRSVDAVCDGMLRRGPELSAPEAATPASAVRRGRFSPEASIVIGDSQSEGLEGSGVMPCVIEDFHGRGTDAISAVIAARPELVRDRALVVLQMGGNDVSGGRGAPEIIDSLKRAIASVRAINPDATIVLSTIPVRGQWLDQLEDRPGASRREMALDGANRWIGQLSMTGVEVFDVNAIAADARNPRLQRQDFRRTSDADVHFNGYGYREIARTLNQRLFAPRTSARSSAAG